MIDSINFTRLPLSMTASTETCTDFTTLPSWTLTRYVHFSREVTDSDSESESDGIRHFFINPKSDGYLKSDRGGFAIFVSVQL